MRRFFSSLLGPCLFLALIPRLATAQTLEFLPEIDAFYRLNSTIRFNFQAKQTRENGDPTQAEIGPSVDFLAKPLIKLKRASRYDPDESKQRALALSFGYRYLPSPDTPTVQRIILAATPNLPLMAGLLLSDRNRGELNFSSNSFGWRYRNRLDLQRTLNIYSHHPIPYASVEFYYDSKYQKWSSTALYAGWRIPFGRSVHVDPYYEHENNTGKAPKQRVNAIGLILGLYF